MEYSAEMNRELGTKWFTFYTKVRPWICCISALTTILDFFKYPGIYIGNSWLLIYFLTVIAQVVLSIMVAIKSDDRYFDFVCFVKGVLVFDVIGAAYGQGVEQYINDGLVLEPEAVGIFVTTLLFNYFVWYRLNVKYFEKRLILLTDNIVPEVSHFSQNAQNKQIEQIHTEPIEKDSDRVAVSCVSPASICFCRKCGERLFNDSRFCHRCGTQIKEEAE